MPSINLFIALVIAGTALWLIKRHIPMASNIKTIHAIAAFVICVWLLQAVGVWGT